MAYTSSDVLVQRGCIVETLQAPTTSLRRFVKARSAAPHTLRTLLGPVARLASSVLGTLPYLFNEQVVLLGVTYVFSEIFYPSVHRQAPRRSTLCFQLAPGFRLVHRRLPAQPLCLGRNKYIMETVSQNNLPPHDRSGLRSTT